MESWLRAGGQQHPSPETDQEPGLLEEQEVAGWLEPRVAAREVDVGDLVVVLDWRVINVGVGMTRGSSKAMRKPLLPSG